MNNDLTKDIYIKKGNGVSKNIEIENEVIKVKPFIKWVGGKGDLLKDIRNFYPQELGLGINKYAEPFIGGGAVLFDILSNYKIEEVYISDLNKQLINVYKIIKNKVEDLIVVLKQIEDEYICLDDEKRKEYFYQKREEYNNYIENKLIDDVYGAALFIFLNRTCFNGLYRVNKKGLFNVPMGAYKNPKICDETNLRNISFKLECVKIVCADYKSSYEFIDENTFVYFDPPYRPISETAKFTSYSKNSFDDKEQMELANYFKEISEKGAKVILSNSDPKNTNEKDDFFDELYKEFNINRIKSKRRINSKANKRGYINELLITNKNSINVKKK